MTENIFRVVWMDHKNNPHKRDVEAMTEHEAMNQIRSENLSYKHVRAIFIPPERTDYIELFKR